VNSVQYPRGRIMVFCKAPEVGKVKTRLAVSVGDQVAATVHEFLAWQCLQRVVKANLAPVELWCSPTIDHPFFQRCKKKLGITLNGKEFSFFENFELEVNIIRIKEEGVGLELGHHYHREVNELFTPFIHGNFSTHTLTISGASDSNLQVDDSATATHTRLLVYDVDNATLERVTVGAADSGGSGFKVLRIPN